MKILIVEGSPLARRLIAEELLPAGWDLVEAESAAEALEILTSRPGIDLMTLGVVLPDDDGFELMARLRADELRESLAEVGNQDVPVVFVTSNDTDTDRLRGFKVGGADFVQKPWPSGHLLTRVQQVLHGETTYADLHTLVVDDSATARTLVHSCLARLGVTVHQAADGDEALSMLRQQDMDLVITDLNMPRMNGDMLCLKIRSELGLEDLPVVFFSASDDKATVLSLFKMGATDYVAKPFLQEELQARLRGHLERIRLQRLLAAGGAPEAVATPVAPARTVPGARVLLAEDSPVSARVVVRLLERLGCTVTTVGDGQAAIDTLAAADEPFDLVFMDLEMPTLGGVEATRRIREAEAAGQAVPIVALTAHDEQSQLGPCLDAGMNDFLVKPVSAPVLKRTLLHWLSPEA